MSKTKIMWREFSEVSNDLFVSADKQEQALGQFFANMYEQEDAPVVLLPKGVKNGAAA